MPAQKNHLAALWAILCFVWICLIGSLTHANEQQVKKSGQDIPDVLKTIPVAGGVCQRDDIITSLENLQTVQTTQTLDLSCAISAKEAAVLLKKPGANLIDLRSSTDYLTWHAPESINLALTDILTKPYLRNKTLVLMGNGKLEAEGIHACMRLKDKGFQQVFMVRGGILGWMQHGYSIQGTPSKTFDALKMTPGELWAASQFVENRIFLDADRGSMKTVLPNATLLSTNAIDALRFAANPKKKKIAPIMGLILITSPGITEDRIRELQQAVLPNFLLIYEGSELEYHTFVNQQKAVLSAQARGPKKLGCGL